MKVQGNEEQSKNWQSFQVAQNFHRHFPEKKERCSEYSALSKIDTETIRSL